ncbi:PA14 domain-containing protein [Leisingera aquimarina]|uniref:PA14 domain-containing protein n=1 Tax=Leisingera aquimarina TaxID=476529 RepID=UPI000407AD55|nr:PA14 domain-containing protein [Leisingera aquimarina]
MKTYLKAAAAIAVLTAASAGAAPLKLAPADPQPSGVKPGLSVVYAYPHDVKSLVEASSALKISSEPGQPIEGLDNRDTEEGQNTLTSKRALNVVARITGYVKIDQPGIHNIDFLTNDGLRARVGGQVVGEYDGRQSCDSTILTEVEVPSAGWYPVDILYFQRLGTACLHMRMGPDGKRPKWMKDSAFGH